jgi:hypothetical protein
MEMKMKPETIARRAAERAKTTAASKANLIARLKAKAAAEPNGIWTELLAETENEAEQ